MANGELNGPPSGAPPQSGKFYRGTIRKLFRGSQGGVVRSDSGREIRFSFIHVVMLGPLRRFEQLREGMRVGFDVGWTSRGLRVTVMRAEPQGSRSRAADRSEKE